jgi:predicted nucleotidyltransferase
VKEALISRLAEFFKPREFVELAYLFGSKAEDSRGPLSDIDIGVYLSSRLTKKERIERLLELTAELTGFLKTDNIDLVVMNDSSPVINFEII